MKNKKGSSTKSFEQSLRRLESIVDQLESAELPLEESLKIYEEGIALSKACMETLTRAELKLRTLSKDVEGTFRLTNSEGTED